MEKRRYPGVSPFEAYQQNIFKGRTEDIKKLKKLISLRDQVLLYSKSGIGKSSLLNAGVLPEMADKFAPLQIRFTAYNKISFEPPVKKVLDALRSFLKDTHNCSLETMIETDLDQLFGSFALDKSLWFYFKKVQLAAITPKKLILVFDQFEELFSYPQELINDFKKQLADLTRLLIPDNIIQQINADISDADKQDEIIEKLSDKMELKTVFAIRSDRLSLLNELSDKIPDIQEVFYELKPLSFEQIEDAIVKPALEINPEFETPAFEYLPASLHKIINELSKDRTQSVETTQLQIICQQIEDIAAQKRANTLQSETVIIEPKDLPKFDTVFYTFYEQSVQKLEISKQTKARLLIEDQLIRNHQRISLDLGMCIDYVAETDLDILVSTHLLRAEKNSIGRLSYELSHDTLVNPIWEARKLRLEKEEEERTERERQEEVRIAHEKQQKQRKRTILVGFLALLFLGIGIFGLMQWRIAEHEKTKAINSQKKTEDLLNSPELKKMLLQTDNVTITDFYPAFIAKAKLAIDSFKIEQAKLLLIFAKFSANTNQEKEIDSLNLICEWNKNFVLVSGGTFKMGSPESEVDRGSDETQHSVTLSSFYMSKFEVTQKQWQEIMGTSTSLSNPSYFKGDDLPVENVSWEDIQTFLQKLNTKTGKTYRLPTEAEWEYAARGGNKTRGYKYSGSNNLGDVAWFTDNSSSKTHTVGQKKANELGIYDMSGNVHEWCSDWYDEKYYSISPSNNPQGASSGSYRVFRGGGWYFYAGFCRVALRRSITPDYRYDYLGFRLVRPD